MLSIKIKNLAVSTLRVFVDELDPVGDDREAVFGDDALRVELHTLNLGELFVFHP